MIETLENNEDEQKSSCRREPKVFDHDDDDDDDETGDANNTISLHNKRLWLSNIYALRNDSNKLYRITFKINSYIGFENSECVNLCRYVK